MHPASMRAYSLDLRSKIVEAVKRGAPKAEAARTFGVGISSVKRYVKMAEESLSLASKKAPGKRKKLDERAMRLLEEDLESRPAAKLKERVEFLFWVLAERVSEATVCRMIRCLGYTRKKIDGC